MSSSASYIALPPNGQALMSDSVPVVIASNQSGLAVSSAQGSSIWGQALSVVAGATPTVMSIGSTTAGYQLKGLIAHGTGDGYFVAQVNGTTVVSGRTRSTAPMLQIVLPNGISITTGSVLNIKVTNESGSTADYDITLLGN